MRHSFVSRIFNWRNFLILSILAVIAFGIWYLGDMRVINDLIKQFFTVIAAYDQREAAAVFIILAAASAMLTFFSSVPLIPIAIVLWGPWLTCILLLGGWTLGSMAAYGIGRAASHFLRGLKIFHKINEYRMRLEGTAEFLVVLFFALAVPAEIVAYTLGILKYSFVKSTLAQLIANAPFAILALYSSSALFGRQPLAFLGLISLGGILMTACVVLFYKRLQRVEAKKVH